MRVLFFLTSLGAGGTERSTAILLPELRARGLDCHVAVLKRTSVGDEQSVIGQGFPIHHVRGRTIVGRVRAMRALVRAVEPDLVHTAVFDADVVGRLAGWRSGTPVVSSLVNTSYDPARHRDANVRRWKLRAVQCIDGWTARHLASGFHAVSEGVADANVEHLRLPRDRISVVERGRAPESIQPSSPGAVSRVRQELGVPVAAPIVLTVGRLEFQKGHVVLLDAIAAMLAGWEKAAKPITVFAGRPGNASQAVAERIRALGLEKHVRVLGHRTDVPDLLAAADVFVLPSWYEGTAGVVLEAMAAGVPVVSSDVVGLRGVLDDGSTAVLVPAGDADALLAALTDVLSDSSATNDMVGRARLAFEQRFTLARSADRMVAFYESAVGL